MWSVSTWLFPWSSQQSQKLLCQSEKTESYIMYSSQGNNIPLPHLYSRGGTYTDAWFQEGRITGGHPRVCPSQWLASICYGHVRDSTTSEKQWGEKTKEIMVKYFFKYGEKHQFMCLRNSGNTQSRVDTNKTTSRHIRVKLIKMKDKKRTLKAAREQWCIAHRGTIFSLLIPSLLIRNNRGQKTVGQQLSCSDSEDCSPRQQELKSISTT